jgi:branched-chain amino acid transport system permease protein
MAARTDYLEEIRLFKGVAGKTWFVVLLAMLLAIPVTVESYLVFLVALAAVHIIIAVGLNLLTGYTGQISLGHAGFIAIGAYTSALLMLKLNAPFSLALPAAGLVSGLFGLALGFPALRLTGPYLAVATLGFGIAVAQVLVKWESLSGGSIGLHPPRPAFGPFTIDSDTRFYYLAIAVMLLMTIGAANLVRSRIGRAFVAIRDSEIAAEAMGVDVSRYKTLAFAISAVYSGIGGALMGHLVGYINPDSFGVASSIYYLSMIVIGGLASIFGSIAGSIFLTALTHILSGIKNLPMVIYGSLLILVVIFEPRGLWGRWQRIRQYWRSWPF